MENSRWNSWVCGRSASSPEDFLGESWGITMRVLETPNKTEIISHKTLQSVCGESHVLCATQRNITWLGMLAFTGDTKLYLLWGTEGSCCTNLQYFVPDKRLKLYVQKFSFSRCLPSHFGMGKRGKSLLFSQGQRFWINVIAFYWML